jgi:hypothetical protein
MHHGLVLKVWGEDEDSARSTALCELEDSITPEHNTVGWDYLSSDHPTIITKGDLKAVYHVKTYAELEQFKLRERRESLDHLIKNLRDDILPMLAPIFMTKTDAPLFIPTENEELTAYIEKLMKRKRDTVRPATFEGIADAVLKIMVSVAKKDTGHSLAMYRMEKIKQVQACLEYPLDTSYTLQCTENYYAELPCDEKGLSPYFFFADRHF